MADVIIIEAGLQERNYWRDVWRYRELFYVLAWRDLSVRYKQTVIGDAWAVIRPVLTMVIFTVIFGRIAKLPSDGSVPYPLRPVSRQRGREVRLSGGEHFGLLPPAPGDLSPFRQAVGWRVQARRVRRVRRRGSQPSALAPHHCRNVRKRGNYPRCGDPTLPDFDRCGKGCRCLSVRPHRDPEQRHGRTPSHPQQAMV